MNKIISILALSMFATLGSAFAGTIYMDANDYGSLPECGGVVQTKIANRATQLNLVFSNVANCSNFDIVSVNGSKISYPNQKLTGRNGSRNGSFTIPASLIEIGSNTIRILIQSNSGKHSDTIVVMVRETDDSTPSAPAPKTGKLSMGSNSVESLDVCGGVVQTKLSHGQLNVIFSNVKDCSNFDIVTANGTKVNYPNQKLQGQNGSRSGSFTLPQSVIEFGGNTVHVLLKSNSGQTSENIAILFFAL